MPTPAIRASTLAVVVVLALAGTTVPQPSAAQDARSIMSEMFQRQQQRLDGVDDFTVVQETMGIRAVQYFEAFGDGGVRLFRRVPLSEIERRRLEAQGVSPPTPAELSALGDGYERVGEMVASELAQQGVPVIPGMTREYAGLANDFLQTAAAYEENDGVEDAQNAMADLARFRRLARYVGTEEVGGRSAYHLQVADFTGIDMPSADGVEFEPARASLWIDTQDYVPLRLLVEGELSSDDGTSQLTIERITTAWSDEEGMFLPRFEVARLTGLMEGLDEEQRREMEEALAQLDEMRAQLDGLPPAQKEMVMERFGPQIAQLERMAQGEGIEVETWVAEVRVNEGPPFDIVELMFSRD